MARTRARLGWLLVLVASTRCGGCIGSTVHPEAIEHHDAGIEHLARGQCVQAEERCRLALEYGPRFEHPHNCLGLVALECRGDLDAAARHFKDAIALRSDFAQAHNNLGTTFFRRDPPDYPAACDEFSAALEIDPSYLDARENYGLCLLRRGTISGTLGDADARRRLYGLARSHFTRLLALNPNNHDAYHHLGFMDLEQQRWDSAEENFLRCLELDPDNPYCHYNLGYVYLETARCDAAIGAFVAALRRDTSTEVAIGARQNLGVAYELCAREDQAIASMLDAMKTRPGDPEAHFALGRLYADKERLDRAEIEWRYALELDPTHCPTHHALARLAHARGRADEARSRCRDFLACVEGRDLEAALADEVARCRGLLATASE